MARRDSAVQSAQDAPAKLRFGAGREIATLTGMNFRATASKSLAFRQAASGGGSSNGPAATAAAAASSKPGFGSKPAAENTRDLL